MKLNDASDFSVLFVEPEDERDALFQVITSQRKPVVLLLAEQTRVFQRPDDFTMLKLARRRHDLTIIFVIPYAGPGTFLANKNGFPVYSSMDQLADAVEAGHLARQRSLSHPSGDNHRITMPLNTAQCSGIHINAHSGMHSGTSFSRGEQTGQSGRTRTAQPTRSSSAQYPPLTPEQPARQPSVYFTNLAGQDVQTTGFGRTGVQERLTGEQERVTGAQERLRERPRPLQVQQRALSTQTPPSVPAQPPFVHGPQHTQERDQRGRRRSLIPIVLVVALLFGIIGSFLALPRLFTTAQSTPSQAAAAVVVGHVTYMSSEQVNESTSQGIADELFISLQNLPAPASGKQYYAWLLGDRSQSDPVIISLGKLSLAQGKVQLLYHGDAQHDNLLINTDRFLITEESASVPPVAPSTNSATWRYYGEFNTTPVKSSDGTMDYSYLDHLRHLLASDPTLDEMELPGGLNTWIYRNTSKLVEWSTSMRGSWEGSQKKDTGFLRRQTSRVLDYLDGTSFVAKDLPAHYPILVDTRLASMGLLTVAGPNQQPPSYLDHIDRHLLGLLQTDASSQSLKTQIDSFTTALSNMKLWLSNARNDAIKIMKMSDAQLSQPAALSVLNDMIDNINHAVSGELDPSTGQMLEGVSWLHDHMNALAMLTITPVDAHMSGLVPQTVGGRTHA